MMSRNLWGPPTDVWKGIFFSIKAKHEVYYFFFLVLVFQKI